MDEFLEGVWYERDTSLVKRIGARSQTAVFPDVFRAFRRVQASRRGVS